MSDVSSPSARAEILSCLEDLADRELQGRVWLGSERPDARYWNAASPINNLDLMLGDEQDPSASIGHSLRNAAEAEAILEVVQSLDIALSQVRDAKTAPDSELLATPAWPTVVEAAAHALEIMRSK